MLERLATTNQRADRGQSALFFGISRLELQRVENDPRMSSLRSAGRVSPGRERLEFWCVGQICLTRPLQSIQSGHLTPAGLQLQTYDTHRSLDRLLWLQAVPLLAFGAAFFLPVMKQLRTVPATECHASRIESEWSKRYQYLQQGSRRALPGVLTVVLTEGRNNHLVPGNQTAIST